MVINIEFVQVNKACISEDAGIKVCKSDGSPAKFKPGEKVTHFFLKKEFVLSCASLRPSLKSTLTRGLFLYSPTPRAHLCSAHFTIPLVYR